MLFKMFHDAAMKYVFKKFGRMPSYLLIIGYSVRVCVRACVRMRACVCVCVRA